MPSKKKNKFLEILRFLTGFSVGFTAWLGGVHCLQVDAEGAVKLAHQKLLKHLLKVFLWALEITLLCHLFSQYLNWLMLASTPEKVTALLVKSVIFLYIRIFWPKVFPEILPGLHMFICPQCYQRQTFRFLPLSFRYGFWVTYLCTHCSCLVNGWGEQVFYPQSVSLAKITPLLMRTVPLVLAALVMGIIGFEFVWKNF